jgi:hypothetical protein
MAKRCIEELTPAQEAQLDPFAEKWLAHGLATEDYSLSLEALTDIVTRAYAVADLAPPRVYRVASPLAVRQAVAWYEACPTAPTQAELDAYLASVAGREDVPLATVTFGFGQHDAGWLSFYDYMREVVGLREETADLEPLTELATGAGWWAFYENAAFVAERPQCVLFDAQGNLHAEGRPAIAWRDGFASYLLRGVRFDGAMSKFVTTPADQLDPREILAIENVDQRAAVIARIGMVKMLEHLPHSIINTLSLPWSEYRLVELTVGRGLRRYLQMENPSVAGLFHLEGVPPTTPTCEAALFYREQGRLPNPGETWVQPEVQT